MQPWLSESAYKDNALKIQLNCSGCLLHLKNPKQTNKQTNKLFLLNLRDKRKVTLENFDFPKISWLRPLGKTIFYGHSCNLNGPSNLKN